MFTGIVETTGRIFSVEDVQDNRRFFIECAFTPELKIDQSIAHDGVCLTVEGLQPEQNTYSVVAIEETLRRSHLRKWQSGHRVNLERCMKADARVDGHFVQGHVDDIGTLIGLDERKGSWHFTFRYNPSYRTLLVEKGSITVNGISLTVASLEEDHFTVAIIPYTFEQTNLSNLKINDPVNLEFDILGKYIIGWLERRPI